MGHSNARITLNIYTDNVMDKVYESMGLLENVAISSQVCYHTLWQFPESMTKNQKINYTICTQNVKRKPLYILCFFVNEYGYVDLQHK